MAAGRAQWPPQPAAWHDDGRGDYRRTREVGDRENSGQFLSVKLRRVVAYESGLEHRFLQLCEASPDVTWYQEQPLVIPYTCAGTGGTTTPTCWCNLLMGAA